MTRLAAWLREEQRAMVGWDFSTLNGRVVEEPLPWDYRDTVLSHLRQDASLLDMGTGGGEFLLSLEHPPTLTSVTEGYAPNLALCRQRLTPLGVRVEQANDDDALPFDDAAFDLIINRHDSFDAGEVLRCLKPGGHFITQQVGSENNRSLSQALIPSFVPPYIQHTAKYNAGLLQDAGFQVLRVEEAFPALRFLDVSALVYFARAIPWEFPGFTVAGSLPALEAMQRQLDEGGEIISREHRFLLVARKPCSP